MGKSRAEYIRDYMREYRQRKREEKLRNEEVKPKKFFSNSTQRDLDFRKSAANSILTASTSSAIPNIVVNHATLGLNSLTSDMGPSTSSEDVSNIQLAKVCPRPFEAERKTSKKEDFEHTEQAADNSTKLKMGKSRADYMREYRQRQRKKKIRNEGSKPDLDTNIPFKIEMGRSRADYMREYRQRKHKEKLRNEGVKPKKVFSNSTQRDRDSRESAANSILTSIPTTASTSTAIPNIVVNDMGPSTSSEAVLNIQRAQDRPRPLEAERETLLKEGVEQTKRASDNSIKLKMGRSLADYMREYRRRQRYQKFRNEGVKLNEVLVTTRHNRDSRKIAANSILKSIPTTASTSTVIPNIIVNDMSPSTSSEAVSIIQLAQVRPHPFEAERETLREKMSNRRDK